MTDRVTELVADQVPVTSPEAVRLLRVYLWDIVGRNHGRPATPAEIDAALAESADLLPPRGEFIILRDGLRPVGCVGVRVVDPTACELKRLFVLPAERGRGLGRRLITVAEHIAREFGAELLRLDTRADLVEARALYAACGFAQVPAFNVWPHAECWYAKSLRVPAPRRRPG